jgi:hypothetical protein
VRWIPATVGRRSWRCVTPGIIMHLSNQPESSSTILRNRFHLASLTSSNLRYFIWQKFGFGCVDWRFNFQ